MATTGILGVADLAAAANTSVYTVPAASSASFSVNFTNRGSSVTNVRLAICSVSSPANSEYIIFDTVIPAKSSLERTGLTAQEGKIIVAYSSSASVSVQVYGYEA